MYGESFSSKDSSQSSDYGDYTPLSPKDQEAKDLHDKEMIKKVQKNLCYLAVFVLSLTSILLTAAYFSSK